MVLLSEWEALQVRGAGPELPSHGPAPSPLGDRRLVQDRPVPHDAPHVAPDADVDVGAMRVRAVVAEPFPTGYRTAYPHIVDYVGNPSGPRGSLHLAPSGFRNPSGVYSMAWIVGDVDRITSVVVGLASLVGSVATDPVRGAGTILPALVDLSTEQYEAGCRLAAHQGYFLRRRR